MSPALPFTAHKTLPAGVIGGSPRRANLLENRRSLPLAGSSAGTRLGQLRTSAGRAAASIRIGVLQPRELKRGVFQTVFPVRLSSPVTNASASASPF